MPIRQLAIAWALAAVPFILAKLGGGDRERAGEHTPLPGGRSREHIAWPLGSVVAMHATLQRWQVKLILLLR